MIEPTPYSKVNALLNDLLDNIRIVLGSSFVGLYLDGSLASGDFDPHSDIDFVAVTAGEISSELFAALQTMHDRLATMDSPWTIQLEGSYLSQRALRRFDPAFTLYPNLQRGPGERLKWAEHDKGWDTHRRILRERGLTLAGPPPATLIDPVSADDLRRGVLTMLRGWATKIMNDPARVTQRGYQSYITLTLCRMLFTLENGDVASKPTAARWAQEVLAERWRPLIERAWEGRQNPDQPAAAEEMAETVALIRVVLERSQPYAQLLRS